jgi:hypothetical protein
MGALLIVLGLVAAGVIVDFIVENGLGTGPDVTFQFLGSDYDVSTGELVFGAAILGALAIALIALGLGVLGVTMGRRRERRAEQREMEGQLDILARRNAELERENVEYRERVATAAPATPPPDVPVVDRDRDGVDDRAETRPPP